MVQVLHPVGHATQRLVPDCKYEPIAHEVHEEVVLKLQLAQPVAHCTHDPSFIVHPEGQNPLAPDPKTKDDPDPELQSEVIGVQVNEVLWN